MKHPLRVGLITDGKPVIRKTSRGVEVANLLIGEGFHWQQKQTATFAGEIEFLQEPQGNIHVVNTVDLEEYVSSVVASEMNPMAPMEFLKAHAVISRSWAVRKILDEPEPEARSCGNIVWEESGSHSGFDVCSDDHCQRYQGVPKQGSERAVQAVKSTEGLVLKDRDGQIADTRFSKCCGGMTELFSTCWADKDYDYLPAQPDPWCYLSEIDSDERDLFLASALKEYDKETADFHDWTYEVNREALSARIKAKYDIDLGKILHLSPIERGESGRIRLLDIVGDNGRLSVGKTLTIRRLLAENCLKSSRFDTEENDNGFLLRGHGWGHGVGLCQIGAARQAAAGKNFREILDFYYPGTKLEELT